MTIGGCLQKAAAIGALRMPGEVESLYTDGTTFILKHFFSPLDTSGCMRIDASAAFFLL